jgi:hypothetical protein
MSLFQTERDGSGMRVERLLERASMSQDKPLFKALLNALELLQIGDPAAKRLRLEIQKLILLSMFMLAFVCCAHQQPPKVCKPISTVSECRVDSCDHLLLQMKNGERDWFRCIDGLNLTEEDEALCEGRIKSYCSL